MTKRLFAMLLALCMIITVFAACGGETATSTSTSTSAGTSTSVSTSTPADAGDTDETENTGKWMKYDDVKLTMLMAWNGTPDANDTWYDNPTAAFIREKIGVTIKNDGCMMSEVEKLNLMFASGDMPDIVSCANWGGTGGETGIIKKGANEGTITEISAYITGDKSDMFQYIKAPFEIGRVSIKYYENDIEFNGDGKLYWIPWQLTGEDDVQRWSYGVFVRGDVPEALNFDPLEVKTTQQLVDIMKQAKDYGFKDANGNDIIVASTFHQGWSYDQFLKSYSRFSLSGYILQDDGTVTTDLLSENWINAQLTMWDLVNSGVFDKECFTHSDDRANQLMGNGTVLFYGAMYDETVQLNSGLLNDHPDWIYEPIGPISYADGKQVVQIESVGRTGSPVIFFPSTCSNLEAALTYFDYLNSPEGQALSSYGIPGVTFDYNEEGLPRANPEYWPCDGDDEETIKAKAEKLVEALGSGGNNLANTQLINNQMTWFKEKYAGASLGAVKTEPEKMEDYYLELLKVEYIEGYAIDGLVNSYDRYQEVAEILDGTTQKDYVQRAFFAETEAEARAILDEYINKIKTDKDGLYLEFLEWIGDEVVGSRDDIAW